MKSSPKGKQTHELYFDPDCQQCDSTVYTYMLQSPGGWRGSRTGAARARAARSWPAHAPWRCSRACPGVGDRGSGKIRDQRSGGRGLAGMLGQSLGSWPARAPSTMRLPCTWPTVHPASTVLVPAPPHPSPPTPHPSPPTPHHPTPALPFLRPPLHPLLAPHRPTPPRPARGRPSLSFPRFSFPFLRRYVFNSLQLHFYIMLALIWSPHPHPPAQGRPGPARLRTPCREGGGDLRWGDLMIW